ncbi:MAG: hypothetical protein E7039_05850 [Lentisphaerae bacterium]|nr:hypothetical protein [Lentisphaerota bacterium]
MQNKHFRILFCVALLLITATASANNAKKMAQANKRADSRYECKENMRNLYLALTNYADLNDGKLPVKDNLGGLKELLPYGVSPENFYCPYYKGEKYKNKDEKKKNKKSSKKDVFTEKNSAYIYFGGINLKSSKNKVPKMIVMCDKFFDTTSGHLRVLLVDGNILELKTGKIEISGKNEKLKKLVDLIDYLAKTYKYPQDVYRALRNKAEKMDTEFKLTVQKN